MKRALWHLRRMIGEMGTAGLLGLGLIAAAIAVQTGPVQWTRQEIRELQATISHARTIPAESNSQAGYEEQLAQFHDFFPSYQTLPQQLQILHEVTGKQELLMGKVDYKLSAVNGTSLKRYEVAYTLVTDYPSLRVYLATLLRTLPNAALEDLELQRIDDESSLLQAKLNLVIYLRDDAAVK